jgi:3-hydroxyisobutyrate dehydrogenase-like beta-hydroxyacid dehydrogenase
VISPSPPARPWPWQKRRRRAECGRLFLDFNSASPGAKIGAAGIVNAAGGRYVEGAVMTSVPPYRIQVPLLLGGPDAAALLPLINAIGFAPSWPANNWAWPAPPR